MEKLTIPDANRRKVITNITISDIKKAVAAGGNISSYVKAWHESLKNLPVPTITSFDSYTELPDSRVMLKAQESDLENLVSDWIKGETEQPARGTAFEFKLLGMPPYGRNTGIRGQGSLPPDGHLGPAVLQGEVLRDRVDGDHPAVIELLGVSERLLLLRRGLQRARRRRGRARGRRPDPEALPCAPASPA